MSAFRSLLPLCGFVVALSSPLAAEATPSKRPNILFIISDDQGWNDYGFMGNPEVSTPHLDRLAAESLTFARGYTPVPLCRPSLATMITGLYPHQHRVTGNDPVLPDKGVSPQRGRDNPRYRQLYQEVVDGFAARPNFVRDLVSRGYLALQTGKWWEGDPVRSSGFTHAMTVGTDKGDRHGGVGLEIGRKGIKPVTDFIESAGGKPWIVWYAPMLPHTPHNPPQRLLAKYQARSLADPVARYRACVEWFDETCGGILGYLGSKGLRENTVIVYVCDNGWIQDPDRRNKYGPRSKLSPYEGGVRTPIMVCWPGKVKPRFDKEHLASSIDIWPTLAALLGTPLPEGLPGINLCSNEAVTARKAIFGEQYEHEIEQVEQPAKSLEHRWMIEGDWKLVAPHPAAFPGAKPQLYHITKDPWENKDLAGAKPELVEAMLGKLDAWWNPARPLKR